LAQFGSNYSPGQLIISAGSGGYANTNYYIDDGNSINLTNFGLGIANGLIQNGAPTNSIIYTNNDTNGLLGHITNGFNVTGYFSWGSHSQLGDNYATDSNVDWSGNSSWYILDTVESYNGRRYEVNFENFIGWYSAGAFGGTNYSNTPVGVVSYVDEPLAFATVGATYFEEWESEKIFSICAWSSVNTPFIQVIGDPFVRK